MTNKFETSRVNVLLLVLLSLFLGSCSDSDNNSPSDSPVTIGISWRSDLDSEFYTNVVTAIKECGATPVLLTQVKCNDITYQDGEVIADCIDEAGHLTLSAASTLRASVDNSNAGDAVIPVPPRSCNSETLHRSCQQRQIHVNERGQKPHIFLHNPYQNTKGLKANKLNINKTEASTYIISTCRIDK